jgi:hypothetical protein
VQDPERRQRRLERGNALLGHMRLRDDEEAQVS